MDTLLISNSVANTGAPRMLAALAGAVCQLGWSKEHQFTTYAPADQYTLKEPGVCRRFYDNGLDFEGRVEMAQDLIKRSGAKRVVANTLRTSYFAIAAKELGVKCMVYGHEMRDDQIALINGGYAVVDLAQHCDLMLWASSQCRKDWAILAGLGPMGITGNILEPCYLPPLKGNSADPLLTDLCAHLQQVQFSVTSIGTVCARKGFDRFVELAKALPEIPFIWVGQFDDNGPELAQEFRDLAKEAKNVTVTGYLSDPWKVLGLSSLTVFLSREDPNPLTIMEAAYNGARFVACVDGLGNKSLPLMCGSGLATYNADTLLSLIRREKDRVPTDIEPALHRARELQIRREALQALVRGQKDFANDVASIAGLRAFFS